MKRVVLIIDRLVLEGFRPEDKQAIGVGLQQGLLVVLGEHEIAADFGKQDGAPRLKFGQTIIEHGSGARRIGERVAQRIGMGLKK